MPFVPQCQWDVFVSYAHVNNVKLGRDDQGWVTEFVHSLQILLNEKCGRPDIVRIWHDPALKSNEAFDDVIAQAIDASAVFVSILSEGYFASEYCKAELKRFCGTPPGGFDLEINNKSRVIPLLLSEAPQRTWPPPLPRYTPVRFFDSDIARFTRTDHFDAKDPYWRQLETVARDVWTMLQILHDRAAAEQTGESIQPTLYLAEVTDDLYGQREQLSRAFLQGRLRILPAEGSLLASPNGSAPVITAGLRGSQLSLHLLNGTPGRPAAPGEIPLARLQYEQALAQPVNRRPIVWIPPELNIAQVSDSDQNKFLDGILNPAPGGPTPELIRCDLEDLKQEILRRMQRTNEPDPLKPRTSTQTEPAIYISHRGQDRADSIAEMFRQASCAVSVLDHSGDEPAVRRRHEKWLALHDGFVIVYGKDTREWAEDIAIEAREFARTRVRLKALATVETPPPFGRFGVGARNIVPLGCLSDGQLARIDEFLNFLRESTNA